MGAIYSNACMTIIAVAGSDPSYGLPGVGFDRPLPFDEVTVGPVHLRAKPDWHSRTAIEGSKWASRAWTLQEVFFSRFRVFFTERELIFSSNAHIICEFTPIENQLHHSIFGPERMADVTSKCHLEDLIEMYSRRDLGRQEDAFNAIAGILNELTKPDTDFSHLWAVPFVRPNDAPSLSLYESWGPGGDFSRPTWPAIRGILINASLTICC